MISLLVNQTVQSVQRLGRGGCIGCVAGTVLGQAENVSLLFSTSASCFAVDGREDGSTLRVDNPLGRSMDRASSSTFLHKVELADLDDLALFPEGRLYHYTTTKGGEAIIQSEVLRPSTRDQHARYGIGQYFTNVGPEHVICTRMGAKLKGDERHYCASELAHRFFNHYSPTKVRKVVSVDLRALVKQGKLYKIDRPYKQADPRCKAKPISLFVNRLERNLELKILRPQCQVVVEAPKPKPVVGYLPSASAKTFSDDAHLVRYVIDKKGILVTLHGGDLNGGSAGTVKRRGLTTILKKNGLYPRRFEGGKGERAINNAVRPFAVVNMVVGAEGDTVAGEIGDLMSKDRFKRIVFVLPKVSEVRSSSSNNDQSDTVNQVNSVIKSLTNQRCMLPFELVFRE